jgi:hypothetical protein
MFSYMGSFCSQVRIDDNGIQSLAILPPNRRVKTKALVERPSGVPAFCIFEYVYFARPDTMFEGQMVHSVRQRCGAALAREHPVDCGGCTSLLRGRVTSPHLISLFLLLSSSFRRHY